MKLQFESFKTEQLMNFNKSIDAYLNKEDLSGSAPSVLFVELTQNCISRCSFCKPNWLNKKEYNMSEDIFSVIVNNFVPKAVLVDLRGWGESLMLPDFHKLLDRVAFHGPKIRIATTLGCGSKETLRSLIDNDVYISLTLDAAEKNMYEKIRIGINFDVVMNNLKFVADALLHKGTLEDDLRFSITLKGDNLDQVEKIVELADSLGVRNIRIVPLQSHPKDKNLLKYHKRKTEQVLMTSINKGNNYGIRFQLGFCPFESLFFSEKIYDPCCHPWLYGYINYKGDFYACEHMLGPSNLNLKLGNIMQNQDDIWNDENTRLLRRNHLIKSNLPGKCQKCYTHGRYADHEQDIFSAFERWNVTDSDIVSRLK